MFKNLHLIISILIVIPVAIIYGFQPNVLFDIQINSIDEANVFKAIMFLYLAFAAFWIVGVLKPNYWKAATSSNSIFMIGLGLGRFFSVFWDGIPSLLFVFGAVGELVLGFYSMSVLKKAK
jgi:hypothetical protein